MKKIGLVLVITCLALTTVGCTVSGIDNGGGEVATEVVTEVVTEAGTEVGTEVLGEISNLPDELLVVCPVLDSKNAGMAQLGGWTSFTVKETTTYTLKVENANGDFNLGIKPEKEKKYALDAKDYLEGTSEEEFTLEPGEYQIMIKALHFQGSYHLKKK